MEEKTLFGGLTVYRERGAFLWRQDQYIQAKTACDEAFSFAPEDVRLLTLRSQVNADVCDPLQAYNDAEEALKLAPKNMLAKNMQARALYASSEFEKSVVTNYRGYRSRKKPPYFKEGIDQGVKTIQDCIGENAGNVMTNFLPMIKSNEVELVDEYEPIKVKRVSRIPKQERVKKLTQLQAKRNVALSRVMAMKYLGRAAYDKFFLETLQKDGPLTSANKAGTEELKKNVEEALNLLMVQQDMLRTQQPYYTIKFAEKTESKYQNQYKELVKKKERKIASTTADEYLEAIDRCLKLRNLKYLMNNAERMQMFLDSKTHKTLTHKDFYLNQLYRAVGEGYLSSYRLSYNLSERGNRRRVAALMGMPVGRPSSFDSVLTSYPLNIKDTKGAVEKVMKTLDMCENLTHKCYLQFELSRLYCQQKNFALSKHYGKLCQLSAKELKDPQVWWMNGLFAMMSGAMQQGNANEVINMVDEAKTWYRKLLGSERVGVEAFLLKCKEMVLNPEVDDHRKETFKRERQILRIMDEKSRDEAEVMFKRMSTMPSRRQFSVVPRKADTNPATKVQADRRKYLQCGLTVVPGPARPLRRPPVSKVRGFQIFND